MSGVKCQTRQTKSLKRSKLIQTMQKNLNQAKMAESEGIQPVVNQAAIQQ